jgi:type II secretory pathway pseudopilin PulG
MIELLVVVAIISILAGLLLPSVSRATHQARKIECLNFQYQLQLFRQMGNYRALEFRDTQPYLGGVQAAASCYDCHPSIP